MTHAAKPMIQPLFDLTVDAPLAPDKTKAYIVLSQTGSIISRTLKIITRAPYNHSSICLTRDLHTMYSFARVYTYNPFYGGFIRETPSEGTFFRFKNTRAMVLEFDVDPAAWDEVDRLMTAMYRDRRRYRYNYSGLLLAGVRVQRRKPDHYYCSQFVKAMATHLGIPGAADLPGIVKPVHFLDLPHRVIFEGNLQEYARRIRDEGRP